MLTTGALMTGMWIEDPGSLSSGNSRLLMFFLAVVAISMVSQAIIFAVMAYGASKAQKRMLFIAEELRSRGMPVIASAEELIRDSIPKVKIITENFVETSHIVRRKASEFDVTLTDVNHKTRAQVARVDGMVSSALSATSSIASTIHEGIRVPVNQVAGVVSGFRVGLNVLLSRAKGLNGYRGRDL